MYSYEDRIRAVELYIKLGKCVRAICTVTPSPPASHTPCAKCWPTPVPLLQPLCKISTACCRAE